MAMTDGAVSRAGAPAPVSEGHAARTRAYGAVRLEGGQHLFRKAT